FHQYGPSQDRRVETRFTQVRAAQVDALKSGEVENRAGEVRPGRDGVVQLDSMHSRSAQPGADQPAAGHVGAPEVDTGEFEARQIAAGQVDRTSLVPDCEERKHLVAAQRRRLRAGRGRRAKPGATWIRS